MHLRPSISGRYRSEGADILDRSLNCVRRYVNENVRQRPYPIHRKIVLRNQRQTEFADSVSHIPRCRKDSSENLPPPNFVKKVRNSPDISKGISGIGMCEFDGKAKRTSPSHGRPGFMSTRPSRLRALASHPKPFRRVRESASEWFDWWGRLPHRIPGIAASCGG